MNHQREEDKVQTYYVSPSGNDRWSGLRPEPNRRGNDGPFATVEAAQRAVRRLKARSALKQPVDICFREGVYELEKPMKLSPRDSGSRGTDQLRLAEPWGECTVTYRGYDGEAPVLSGGRRITGWRREEHNGIPVWTTVLPEVKRGAWSFRQLWVNGQRRRRTCLPREGFYRADRLARKVRHQGNLWWNGDDRFVFAGDDLSPDWKNLGDVEVVVHNYWVDSRMRIGRIDPGRRVVVFDRPCRTQLLDDRAIDGVRPGACYRVENVCEALGAPGEWYLDRPTGTLIYVPMPGEDPETTEVIAPRLDQVLVIEGGSLEDNPVEGITFSGITFAHTEWNFPDDVSASNQAANEVPGAVCIRHASRIRMENCTVAHVGGYGIECAEATRDVEIVGCSIVDLGAGGLKVWHGCARTLISDNEIGDGGHVYHAGVGVLIGQSSGNRLLHNHIHGFDYTGVSVGWHWGYGEGNAYGNILEHNHIHHIGRGRLSDMAGIYTLGVQPGSRIRHNVIHDVWSRTYGGWGIYPDEGSSYLLIENNLAYRTKSGGFHQHYGRENVVRNNIFALARDSQLNRSRIEDHESFTFERNVVYLTEGEVWAGGWAENRATIRNNLYFDPERKRLRFGGMTFRQWQKRGLDEGSVIEDPGFVNPEAGDFRLKKGSRVSRIGFVGFDTSGVGPRDCR